MNQSLYDLPKGWKWEALKDNLHLCDSGIWGSPPSDSVNYPVLRSNNIQDSEFIYDSDIAYRTIESEKVEKYRLQKGDILVVKSSGSKNHIGKCAIFNSEDNTIFLFSNFTQRLRTDLEKLLPEYLYYYLISDQGRYELEKMNSTSSGLRNIQIKVYQQQKIPLPPLPVQEIIVEILQKADEIRRKRKEALAIADLIPQAVFNDIFGDVNSSTTLSRLGKSIISIRNGISRRRKAIANEGIITLRIQDVEDGSINFENPNRIALTEREQDSSLLEKNDLLLVRVNGNPNLVGRNALFTGFTEPVAHNDHLMRVRLDESKLIPEFVSAFLRTSFGRHELSSKVSTSAGNHTINQDGLKDILIPYASISKQKAFLRTIDQFQKVKNQLIDTLKQSHHIFNSLLSQAFTGELTAEWETENREYIIQKQQYYQQLPQLILLSFLQKKRKQTLVTELMKYVFLLQMEGITQQRYYQFIPYHYGPFAKELYTDLETLQQQGLIQIDDSDKDKTRITITDNPNLNNNLNQLPDDIKEDITAIINHYSDLDLNTLLNTVYEKYPAYTTKSKLKNRTRKKTTET